MIAVGVVMSLTTLLLIIILVLVLIVTFRGGSKKQNPDNESTKNYSPQSSKKSEGIRRIEEFANAAKKGTVILDLETTGLNADNDEIVEITIIDEEEGKPLLNTLVKPANRKRWNKAQEIHGISPKMVKDAPTYLELIPIIKNIIQDKMVVIYNANYDTKFLRDVIDEAGCVVCCMLRYSEYRGIPDQYGRGNKWFKLIDAARNIGYKFEGDAHRALADTLATRAVWMWLNAKSASMVFADGGIISFK